MRRSSRGRMVGRAAGTGLLAALGAAAGSPADELESALRRAWDGAWAITRTAAYSDCGDHYTDTRVEGIQATGGGDFRFEAGEVVRLHKLDLERKKLEVFLDLDETILVPWRDGPFTLYAEKVCKVELEIVLPARRSDLDAGELEALLASVLEPHPGPDEARASPRWNRRRRDPYPADYERTLAEYQAWKVVQTNLAVGEAIRHAVEEASRIAQRVDDDPEFLEGFAEGARGSRREHRSDDCGRLLGESPDPWVRAPDRKSKGWREGYVDGWKLVLHLERGRLLHRCFLAPPPAAAVP